MKIQNPHDKFYKETMGNISTAKDFLENYLPESIMDIVDLNTLQIQKDSFINPDLDDNYSDLLFQIDISGKEGYLYFMFEHKSYPDKGVILQLLKYMIEIWESKMNKEGAKILPVIIPIVIYHGSDKWHIASSLGEMLNGYDILPDNLKTYIPNFKHILYDISLYNDEDIKGKAETRILLTLLRDIYTKSGNALQESVLHSLQYLNELEDKQTGIEYLETMIRYVLSAGRSLEPYHVQKMVNQIERTYPKGSELTMTMAEKWIEEGMQKGMQEGMKKGLEKGGEVALAETATQLLTEKFGKIPQDIKDGITELDTATLKLILFNIFKYEDIEDVRRYI